MSVIVAAWRAADHVGRAVASALAQPETLEVIVADDASGDDGATLAAAKAADDGTRRLKLIALPRNGGPAAARNAAIAESTGAWIAILDSDDYFLPGRLGQLLAASDGYDLIADDLTQVDEGAPESSGQRLWFGAPGDGFDITLEGFVRGNMPNKARPRGELGFIKPILRRSFLDAHGLRYQETMRLGEDYDLYARLLAARGRARLLNASGYVGVRRKGSLSDTTRRHDLAMFVAADDRLLFAASLTEDERAALLAHRHTVARVIAWIDFVQALKRKRPDQALGVVIRYPAGAPHILEHLWGVTRKRVGQGAG